MQHRCLKCGAVKRGKKSSYPCPKETCTGHTAPVTANMSDIVQVMWRMGYRVTGAEGDISYNILDSELNLEVVFLTLDFGKLYTPAAFPELPDGFICREVKGAWRSQIVLLSEGVIVRKDECRRYIRSEINRLYKWACSLEEQGITSILYLAGLI